ATKQEGFMKHTKYAFAVCLAGIALMAGPATAAEEVVLTVKDHSFLPETLEVPADTEIKIVILNEDSTSGKFDSVDLQREEDIHGGGKTVVMVGPLAAGSYNFTGKFKNDTATGQIIAR